MNQNSRRIFLKGALLAGGTLAVSFAFAGNSKDKNKNSGVVYGKSNKKEILYKKTQNWEEYYKNAL